MIDLKHPGRTLVTGAPEGHDAHVLGRLVAGRDARTLLHVCRDDGRMAHFASALAFFHPKVETLSVPAWDCLPYDRVSPNGEVVSRRIDALTRLADGEEGARPRLVLTTCTTCDITCEQRPTVQALQHLFGEALALVPGAGAVTVTGRRHAGTRSLEIRVERGSDPLPLAAQRNGAGTRKGSDPLATNRLRVILARLLLEMQGATLVCSTGGATWVALVEFPGRA